jgi:hypothetical protein
MQMRQALMTTPINEILVGLVLVKHVSIVQCLCMDKGSRVLPALMCDGIIALDILEGSVSKGNFISFLQQLVHAMSTTRLGTEQN